MRFCCILSYTHNKSVNIYFCFQKMNVPERMGVIVREIGTGPESENVQLDFIKSASVCPRNV
jgi:hypothetical protein